MTLVGQRHVNAAYAHALGQTLRFAPQSQLWLTQLVVVNLKLIKRQPIADAGTKRLGRRFFNGKTLGQKTDRLLMLFPYRS